MRLRIEHEDVVGVGPFVHADFRVEDVAQVFGGLRASVQDDLKAAGLGRAGLASLRRVEITHIREAIRSRRFAGNEFPLVEGEDAARWRGGRGFKIPPVDRLQFGASLIVAAPSPSNVCAFRDDLLVSCQLSVVNH